MIIIQCLVTLNNIFQNIQKTLLDNTSWIERNNLHWVEINEELNNTYQVSVICKFKETQNIIIHENIDCNKTSVSS